MPQASCKTGEQSSDSGKLQFEQVAGLWIMLAVACALSFLLVVFNQLQMRAKRHMIQKKWVQQSSQQLRLLTRKMSLGSGRSKASGVSDEEGGGSVKGALGVAAPPASPFQTVSATLPPFQPPSKPSATPTPFEAAAARAVAAVDGVSARRERSHRGTSTAEAGAAELARLRLLCDQLDAALRGKLLAPAASMQQQQQQGDLARQQSRRKSTSEREQQGRPPPSDPDSPV